MRRYTNSIEPEYCATMLSSDNKVVYSTINWAINDLSNGSLLIRSELVITMDWNQCSASLEIGDQHRRNTQLNPSTSNLEMRLASVD